MKKENKEMLKTIISNQELIMKALKIEIPVKKIAKESSSAVTKKVEPSKQPIKKTATKKPVKKAVKK
jgi:hypothetical protein